MTKPIKKLIWILVGLLGVVPVVGLILSICYHNLDAFWVALFMFEMPMFITVLIIGAFQVMLYFRDKREIRRRKDNFKLES